MPRILIGADFVPTKSNEKEFKHSAMGQLVDESLYRLVLEADYRIFNLEVPLTNISAPIKKSGPNLIADVDTINGYKQLGVDFLTLANNHILDQGEQGLWSTIEQLDQVGIAHAGVGHNLNEASKPYIFEIEGKRIGIYCCAEHEFTIATENRAGANPFDPLESLDHIVKLKKQCDYVICLYHGGKEHYRYPSPYLQKVCRKIIEKGANIVVCQHSHCIGCREIYHGGTIIYGQGNFLFDHSESEFWKTSLLIAIDTVKNEIEYIPIEKRGKGVALADENSRQKILDEFYARSNDILSEGFIDSEYAKFAYKMRENYIGSTDLLGSSVLFRAVYKLSHNKLRNKLIHTILKKKKYWLINQYDCEAHRELILKGLEVSSDE